MAGVLCFAYSFASQGGPRSYFCFIIVLGRYHFAGSHRYSLKCSLLHAIMTFMVMHGGALSPFPFVEMR